MPRGGQNRKPPLAVVREGNPGKRPIRDAVVLPPSALREPVWAQLLPGNGVEIKYVRKVASDLWLKLAPTLSRSVGLVGEQQETLVDYCVTYARIVQGERALSREGVIVKTERGQVKNAWTTVLNQYRPHLRALVGELGLSPSAAGRLKPREGGDGEEDPFD
jgi:P27 family predicted phage terminase small subunit